MNSGRASVSKIFSNGRHCAFTDLIRHGGRWFCVFREAERHAGGEDGVLRILTSVDGIAWESPVSLSRPGCDLRDPHFSVTPDGRLCLVCGGRVFANGAFGVLQSFVAFSADGTAWSEFVASGPADWWIWRITWHKGSAYSWARFVPRAGGERKFRLLRSADAITWEFIAGGPDEGNEATIFFEDDRMFVLARAANSLLGTSEPPYAAWCWNRIGYFVGGPNCIALSDGRFVAGGRLLPDTPFNGDPVTKGIRLAILARIEPSDGRYIPCYVLPGGGDCAYPGLVEHEGELWVSYYSSSDESIVDVHAPHACDIFLARIPLDDVESLPPDRFPPYAPTGPCEIRL